MDEQTEMELGHEAQCLEHEAQREQMLSEAQEAIRQLQAKNEKLKDVLFQHRWDLHQGSGRPCPTCRQSAEALGLNVPNQCAEERFDRQALKDKASQ